VAVLIEDSKCERNMSMIPYNLHISTLTSNHLIRIYRGVSVDSIVRAPRRTQLVCPRVGPKIASVLRVNDERINQSFL
jgi:hypothetical protein